MKRVRLRFGESEIEVEGDSGFIRAQLAEFYRKLGVQQTAIFPDLPKAIEKAAERTKIPSPAEFIRAKQPETGTENLLVLASYLENFRSSSEFSQAELNRLAREAKIKRIVSTYFTRAVKQGLLRGTGRGKYSLTLSGEDAVAAMATRKAKSEK